MTKNFKSFQEFLDSLCFSFSAICLSETWCQSHETSNSNLKILGYVSLHQTRKIAEGEGFSFSYLNLSFIKSEMTQL